MHASRHQLLLTALVCLCFAAFLLVWIMEPTFDSVLRAFR
jgi:hypothetical protein